MRKLPVLFICALVSCAAPKRPPVVRPQVPAGLLKKPTDVEVFGVLRHDAIMLRPLVAERFIREIKVGCHGPDWMKQTVTADVFVLTMTISSGHHALGDAIEVVTFWNPEILRALIHEGCPLDSYQFNSVVMWGKQTGDFGPVIEAIRQGHQPSRWIEGFAFETARAGNCDMAIQTALSFELDDDSMEYVLHACNIAFQTQMRLRTGGWPPIEKNRARLLFYEALQVGQYQVAFALIPATGKHVDLTIIEICEDAFRTRREISLAYTLPFQMEYLDRVVNWAIDHNHYRFAGTVARTPEQTRLAFDEALRKWEWEDAAEIAEFGVDEKLKSEAPLLTYRIARAAKDIEAARAIKTRYGIVDDEPVAGTKTKPRRKKRPCPPSTDWQVKRGCRETTKP